MRNLWALEHSIGSAAVDDVVPARAVSINAETQVMYCVHGNVLTAYELATQKVLSRTAIETEARQCVCVAVQHLQLGYDLDTEEAVCVAFGHGEIFVVKGAEVECVGYIDVGIAAVGWAPDQELLAIINCAGTLLIMTRQFYVLSEAPLETDDFGVAKPINVGWGKRETQFQGKAGKAAIHQPLPDAEVPADDSAPRISWRGDGEFFATSTKPDGCPRRLRVWDRNGVLQSTSEKVNGLEQSLAWRPSGNLIASTQRLPNRHDVVFFERNGLRHGEFTLPFAAREVQVIELGWNCDSTVLAVWIERLEASPAAAAVAPTGCVQLWTSSNYHWYLKQEYRFEAIRGFAWDPESAGRLSIVVKHGEVHHLRHDMGVDCSLGLRSTNDATVAVHDGHRVLLTSFRAQCIPPPMCSEAIDVAALLGERCCARSVVFTPTAVPSSWGRRVPFAVVSSTDRLALVLSRGGVADSPTLLASLDLRALATEHGLAGPSTAVGDMFVRQACWTAARPSGEGGISIVCNFLCLMWVDGADELIDFDVELSAAATGASSAKVVRFSTQSLPSAAVRLQASDCRELRNAPVAMLALASGEIMACMRFPAMDTVHLQPWSKWLVAAEQTVRVTRTSTLALVAMKAAEDSGADVSGFVDLSDDEDDGAAHAAPAPKDGTPHCDGSELALVTLSDAGHLCLNGHQLASNCNSFAVHDCFILFATHNHTCHFVSTRVTVTTAVAAFDGGAASGGAVPVAVVRNVERGTRIVTVVPFGTRVVLQMPRGNLEVVTPRPLLLVALQTFLDRRDYRRAFLLARKNRLNLNLLYDRNSDGFDEEVGTFITALGDPTYVNVFLSDLRDEDHASSFNDSGMTMPPTTAPGKRDRVCDAVRQSILGSPHEQEYLLTVVHSFICRSAPLYEELLEYIRTVRTRDAVAGPAQVDRALKYAVVVVKSADVLFDSALGTYDFDLVIMVAKVAQKDPKEYLAFLEELAALPEALRKHRIDMHLKRYERALANLARAGDDHFEECLALIGAHQLHAAALRIFQQIGDAKKTQAVQALGAAHLRDKKSYREAGLLFHACGEDERALDAFVAGLEWRWAMITVIGMEAKEGGPDRTVAVARDLAAKLEEKSQYREAASIAQEYLDDFEYAVVLLVSGKAWAEALRIIASRRRPDLLETHLKPAVQAAATQLIEGYGAGEGGQKALLERHRDRLAVVRKEKIEKREAELYLDEDVGPQSDLYSDTSSRASTRTSRSRSSRTSGSSGSRSSRKTHRSKRRDRAKQTSLREGGIFEETALLDAINKITLRVDSAGREIPDLCSVLHFLGDSAIAAEIEAIFDDLRATLTGCHDAVWSLHQMQATTLADPEAVNAAAEASARQQTQNARSSVAERNGGAVAPLGRSTEAAVVEALVTDLRTVTIDSVVVNVPPRTVATDAPSWRTSLLKVVQ